jgi:hypothetical protein
MNGTHNPEDMDVQNTVEIVLLVWTILEQFLSFSPENYPKSVSQLIMFIMYRTYRTAMTMKKKPVDKDVENNLDGQSVISTASWRSLISVNVGP